MPPKSTFSDQLDRIENAIIGNGREGLLGRTARIEERLNSVNDLAEETKKVAEGAVDKMENEVGELRKLMHQLETNVIELEGALKTHVGTDHLSVLMRKKQFWAIIIIGFIFLHIVSTYMPNLWDFIVVLLGVPKLVIPLN